MRRVNLFFLLACLILCGLSADFSRAGVAGGAQEGRGNGQGQTYQSRDLDDSFWRENRKPSKQQPARQQSKRRAYRREVVASSSAGAVKYQKPSAARPPRRPAYSAKPILWQDVALASAGQVGVTIWRLRQCDKGEDDRRCFLGLEDAGGRAVLYEAVRVTTEADFREGDGIQLAVESPVKGYIYVIHQEVYKKGTSHAKLLYPLCKGSNSIGPGRPLMIPTQIAGEGIKVLKMRNEQGKNLVAERLKIIIASKRIEGVCAEDDLRFVASDDVRRWESQWSGRLELFDLEGGEKETMTLNEWSAMKGSREGSRDLTTEDLAPQKLYLVERKRKDGVLITLDLPYGNRRARARGK